MKKFANAPKDTWANIAKLHYVILSAWTAAIVRRREFAVALPAIKEEIVKEVMIDFGSNTNFIYKNNRSKN